MILIVGLGNPGRQYEKTRHNLGFRVIDLLAERWGFDHYDARFDGETAKGRAHGRDVLLLKPQTFMNLSGASVAACARYHKIAPSTVWVAHDDIDLPLGRLRLRVGGSSGGHNGVQSVIERLGSAEFLRIRMGVARPASPIAVDDYVLQPFGAEEKGGAATLVVRAADAIEAALRDGVMKAMNVFNQ